MNVTVRILFKVLKIFDVFGAFQGLDMMLPWPWKNCLHVKFCASQTYRYIVLETRIITVILLIILTNIYSSETRIITVIFLLTSLRQLIWHVSVSWGCSWKYGSFCAACQALKTLTTCIHMVPKWGWSPGRVISPIKNRRKKKLNKDEMIVLYWELCSFNRLECRFVAHTPGMAFRHLPPSYSSLSLYIPIQLPSVLLTTCKCPPPPPPPRHFYFLFFIPPPPHPPSPLLFFIKHWLLLFSFRILVIWTDQMFCCFICS